MPTENRSTMISVPRELLAHIEVALDRHMAGHVPMRIPVDPTDYDLVREEVRALLAQPALHQGEPVAWLETSAGLSWLVERMTVAPGTKLYTHPAPAVRKGEPILLEAVAVTRENDDGLYLDWLIEGGISAMEHPGVTLLVAPEHPKLCEEDGSVQVWARTDHGEVERLVTHHGITEVWINADQYAVVGREGGPYPWGGGNGDTRHNHTRGQVQYIR